MFMERVFFLNLSVVMKSKFEELSKRGLLHSGTIKPMRLAKETTDDLDLGEANLGGSADSDDEASEENKGRSMGQKRAREDYGGEEEERIEMEGEEEEGVIGEAKAEEEEEKGDDDGNEDEGTGDKDDEDGEGGKGDDELSDAEGEPTPKKQKTIKKSGPDASAGVPLKKLGKKRPGAWLKEQVEDVRVFELDQSNGT